MRTFSKIMIRFIYFIFGFQSFLFHFQIHAEIPADIKKIISRGKIIVAIHSEDYPPFFYSTKDKKFEGFDVEIAEDIAIKLGVSVEYKRTASTFNNVIKLVENEKADIAISAISATVLRGLSVRFSDPYITPNQCLILNRVLESKITNKIKINSENLKIAIINNSSYADFSKQNSDYFNNIYKNLTIIHYDSLDKALTDVIEGNILGIYLDEIHAKYIIKKRASAHIYVRMKIITESIDPISIVVNWKKQNLVHWINLYIKSINNNGKKRALILKYLKDQNDQ